MCNHANTHNDTHTHTHTHAHTHTHTHKEPDSLAHTLRLTHSLLLHCPADLWEMWLPVPWPCDGTPCPTLGTLTHTHKHTQAGTQPSLVGIWVATPKDGGVHGLSLGLIGWELSNDHGGGEQGASFPPKINFNQRGDAILSNVKSTAALGPVLQQKIIPDSHLAT